MKKIVESLSHLIRIDKNISASSNIHIMKLIENISVTWKWFMVGGMFVDIDGKSWSGRSWHGQYWSISSAEDSSSTATTASCVQMGRNEGQWTAVKLFYLPQPFRTNVSYMKGNLLMKHNVVATCIYILGTSWNTLILILQTSILPNNFFSYTSSENIFEMKWFLW